MQECVWYYYPGNDNGNHVSIHTYTYALKRKEKERERPECRQFLFLIRTGISNATVSGETHIHADFRRRVRSNVSFKIATSSAA